MKRNRWGIILIFIILTVTYGLFGYTLMTETKALPDTNWSRQVEIARIENCDIHEVRNHQAILVIPFAERNEVMTIYWKDQLHYRIVTFDGTFVKEGVIKGFEEKVDQLELTRKDKDELVLYVLKEGMLTSVDLDLIQMEIRSRVDLADDVRGFKANHDVVVVRQENKFQVLTHSNAIEIPFEDLEKFELFGMEDQSFLVYTEVLDDQKRHLRLLQLKNDTCAYEVTDLAVFPNTTFVRTRNISLKSYEDHLYIVYENQDYRTGESNLFMYDGKMDETLEFQQKNIQKFDHMASPKIVEVSSEGVVMAVTIPQIKGNDKLVENIVQTLYVPEDQEMTVEKQWTKTDQKSILLSAFKSGEHQYITWVDEGNSEKHIYLAGDAQPLIKKSQNWTKDEFVNTSMILLFSLLPILFTTLFPSAAIIGPVVLLLFLLSIRHLTWLESNSRKVVWVTVGLHTALKTALTFRSIVTESLVRNVESQFPVYLSNPTLLLMVLLIMSVISYGITQFRLGDANKDEFWAFYIQFAVMDMLIFGLLVMPYYYSYVGWGLFFSN